MRHRLARANKSAVSAACSTPVHTPIGVGAAQTLQAPGRPRSATSILDKKFPDPFDGRSTEQPAADDMGGAVRRRRPMGSVSTSIVGRDGGGVTPAGSVELGSRRSAGVPVRNRQGSVLRSCPCPARRRKEILWRFERATPADAAPIDDPPWAWRTRARPRRTGPAYLPACAVATRHATPSGSPAPLGRDGRPVLFGAASSWAQAHSPSRRP